MADSRYRYSRGYVQPPAPPLGSQFTWPGGYPEWLGPEARGIEAPFFDPVDIAAGGTATLPKMGARSLLGLIPDAIGGAVATAAEDVSPWLALPANVATNVLAGNFASAARNAVNEGRLLPTMRNALANQRGMYVPPTAEDLQKMFAMGDDSPRIFSALHDRMPRMEIDDSALRLDRTDRALRSTKGYIETPEGLNWIMDLQEAGKPLRVPDFVKGDAAENLYEQAPYLRDVKVDFTNYGNAGASYRQASNQIDMKNTDSPTLLHELQHAVQERGGWARGGSPESMDDLYNQQMARLKFLETEEETANGFKMLDRHLDEAYSNPNVTPNDIDRIVAQYEAAYPGIAEANRITKSLGKFDDGGGFSAYKRLAGEIESRDTAARMSMNALDRARTSPYSGYAVRPDGTFGPAYDIGTNDLPASDYIVRRDGGKATMSSDPKKETWEQILQKQRQVEGLRAAIKDPQTGKVYTGWTHQAAIEKAPKYGTKEWEHDPDAWGRLSSEWDKETNNVGFIDKDGNFITREDAGKNWGIYTVEDAKDFLRKRK